MTDHQNAFYFLVSACSCPNLIDFWDRETHQVKADELKQFMAYASSGERALLKFFLGVWHGQNAYGFDLFTDLGALDTHNQSIIAAWVARPFFP